MARSCHRNGGRVIAWDARAFCRRDREHGAENQAEAGRGEPGGPADQSGTFLDRVQRAGSGRSAEPESSASGAGALPEVGRASWRERVCQYGKISVDAVSLKKQDTSESTPQIKE